MASPPVSPSLTRTTSAIDPTSNLTPTATWTSEQEARLIYCQDQLKQAQKKWSDRQELWIREVEHLVELKRLHQKAQKKQRAHALRKLSGKKTTWKALSRTQSNNVEGSGGNNVAVAVDDDGDEDVGEEEQEERGEGEGEGEDEAEGEEDSLGEIERSDSLPLRASISSPTSPTTQFTNRNPFKKIIRRMSSASVSRSGEGEFGRRG